MRRRVAALGTILVLFDASCALAHEHGSIRIALNSGIAASTASEEYGGLMVLPGKAIAVGGGFAIALAGPLWGIGDVSYFRIGSGQFWGRTFGMDPSMDRSAAVTAMGGVELAARDQDRLAPFVLGSLGVGHVSIGDMITNQGTGAAWSESTKPMTAPAFALGFGLRTAATSSGLNASFGIRWVSIRMDDRPMNIVPFTVGIAF